MELVNGAVQLAEEFGLLVPVHNQDVLSKPVQMTDIVVDEMLELCLVWDALDEVDEDAIDLLIEKMVKLLL